jgi:hypothetical protein
MKRITLILFLFFAFVTICNSQNMSNPHVRNHVKLQKELSYDVAFKNNTAYTIKSAKEGRSYNKKKSRSEKKRGRRLNRIKRINSKT